MTIKVGRISAVLACNEKDRRVLEELSCSQTAPIRSVERAALILKLLANTSQASVARELRVRPNTVNKWYARFRRKGLEGLADAARSGRPKTVGHDLRSRLLKQLELSPPRGQSSWDGRSLARALGVKKTTIYTLLEKDRIQLQRMRSWCVSTDKEFAAKAADVTGLYLNPPEKAIVFAVDEKPTIQALSRKTGYVETSSGKIVQGLQSTYRRNGTLNLFAALNVATGAIKSKTTKTKKRPDFLSFMDDVVKELQPDQEIHVILDNYCTHKGNDTWLRAHPNVTFHFTPTSASWLNMVEIWLGILTRKALKGASFNSAQELAQAIEEFCEVYNQNPHPFIWRKREVRCAQLRNTIANLAD